MAFFAGFKIWKEKMTDIRLLLAENMKKFRKIQKISQEKLAEKIGTAHNYIALIEVGKKFPSAGMLERIALALNVDTPELFNTGSVTIFQNSNKSMERTYQEIMLEVKHFEKFISDKLKSLQ